MTTFDPRAVHSIHPNHVGQPYPAQRPQLGAQPYVGQQFIGQQFPGPVPPPPPPSRKRPLAAKLVAGVVAAGLVVGGACTWMAFSGSSAEAAVQSTSFAGANPTTSPFGTDAPQVAAVAATGPQAGDTKGLFAATTPPACTTADFLSQLQADPNKLAAFGGVFGLGARDVPAFVNSLSPVVLRANTSVTDHPFSDGAFVAQPAILAAGTAVLVNSYGEPTVKCFNGNPLTAGAAATGAVTVTPTTQAITQFRFTSIDNTSVVVTAGKPDPKPNPGPNPTTGTPGQPNTKPQADPVLAAKAADAKRTATKALVDATAARQKADDADTAARIAQAGVTSAGSDLSRAIQAEQDGFSNADQLSKAATAARAAADRDPLNQVAQARASLAEAAFKAAEKSFVAATTARQRASAALDQAKADLATKQNQAKTAGAAATSAEGTAAQAAKNAKDAQDKADQSAKTPAGNNQNQNTPQTLTGVNGQAPAEGQAPPAEGQTAATPAAGCDVVTNTTTTCTPAGAVAGTTPATGTAAGTGTDTGTGTTAAESGTTSTGSTGTSSSQGSSSSSSGSSSSNSSNSSSSSAGASTGSSQNTTSGGSNN